jgi:putative ABC transport system permease protein
MSLWHIAWSYLWSRRLTTALTILSVALAVGLISALLTVRDETRARFEEEQAAFDVVVGPPGSPLQLVLNAVYFLDSPTGRLEYADYLTIREHEHVKNAYPVALGDTYKQHRIVGTERALFDYDWESIRGEKRNPFVLAEGEFFTEPMQAVVGAQAAKATGLTLGATFIGTHGTIDMGELSEYNHEDTPFTVVGILRPSGTSNDRAIFVDIESVWEMHADHEAPVAAEEPVDEHAHEDEHDHAHGDEHEHDHEHGDEHDHEHADGQEDEHEHDHGHAHEEGEEHEHHALGVTAVLVDLESPLQRFTFQAWARQDLRATAAIPYNEILTLYNRVLQPAVIVLIAVGYVVVVISALSILIGLYLAIIQRKRDLAIMRALGASASEIFGAVLIEAFLVTLLGIVTGWALGKSVAYGLGLYLSRSYGLGVHNLSTSPEEWGFFGVVGVVGLLAGVIPAWQAYRTDVARDLASN